MRLKPFSPAPFRGYPLRVAHLAGDAWAPHLSTHVRCQQVGASVYQNPRAGAPPACQIPKSEPLHPFLPLSLITHPLLSAFPTSTWAGAATVYHGIAPRARAGSEHIQELHHLGRRRRCGPPVSQALRSAGRQGGLRLMRVLLDFQLSPLPPITIVNIPPTIPSPFPSFLHEGHVIGIQSMSSFLKSRQ